MKKKSDLNCGVNLNGLSILQRYSQLILMLTRSIVKASFSNLYLDNLQPAFCTIKDVKALIIYNHRSRNMVGR